MKNALILLLVAAWMNHAESACSSQITRTNSSALTTLTASKYNTDVNTVYSRVNELPGDCITDETITSAKIDDGTIVNADISTSAAISLSKLAPTNYSLASPDSGSFTTTSTSYVDITDQTVTITTIGRPVLISLTGGTVTVAGTAAPAIGTIKAIRGASDLAELVFASVGATNPQGTTPGGAFLWIDTPAAGTYTYKIQGKTSGAGVSLAVSTVKLFVREL